MKKPYETPNKQLIDTLKVINIWASVDAQYTKCEIAKKSLRRINRRIEKTLKQFELEALDG